MQNDVIAVAYAPYDVGVDPIWCLGGCHPIGLKLGNCVRELEARRLDAMGRIVMLGWIEI